ncbi:hypothetical protein [Streptomyces aidingensis]|uniref:Uncharacterized protein n=1 Tax=Streptomyces aidingensis TaxID=910347 RepID=A0A1I1K6F8_9ACTN|nr:hypothetical protein [Streptomyces aidingensis]SFC56567.1 hypothetical protein SAMN05421773_104110 [Streptomyces aidingensis]
MKSKRARAGLAVAAVAGVGLMFPAVALAADDGRDTGGDTSAPEQDTAGSERRERQEERQEQWAGELAEELGVAEEDVAAALEKFRTEKAEERQAGRQERLAERLDKAVSEGTLTQEQADAILAAAENGVLPGPGGHGGHGGPGGMPRGMGWEAQG